MNNNLSDCQFVRDRLSEWLDETLPAQEASRCEVHCSSCDACRIERDGLRSMLGFLHALPPKEPMLDMLQEMQPEIARIVHEQRLPWAARLRLQIGRIASNAAAGAIVFTGLLARNTDRALRRFLIDDPFETHQGARP
jgi:anti-sigma factor RsiW